jgi:RNA polymerase sigma factor (sigma-70 family)
LTEILQQLGRLSDLQGDLAQPDTQLLERFVAARDDAAFTALVVRHGPMVLGVCRRQLTGVDVEDAFQATFLVLVRKAGAIGRRELLGNWLYGVAFRVASDLRATAQRRDRHRCDLDLSGVTAPKEPDASDLPALLDAEVGRLPARYRRPVILCYLQGQTNEEAARQLCWPVGTVKSRLSRARDLLRTRLARRGVALSAAAVAEALAANVAAALPSGLLVATARAALDPTATAVSARAAILSTGVLRMLFFKRLKVAIALVALMLGAGAVLFAVHAASRRADSKTDATARDREPDQSRARDKKPDRRREDKDLLQGVWDVVGVEAGGKEPRDGSEKNAAWEFKGDRVYLVQDYSEESGTFTLDSGKTPRTMNVSLTPFIGERRTIPCIYQLDGDTLKICLGWNGTRPTAFATRAGEETMLVTFKRRAVEKAKGSRPGDALRRRYGDKTIAILQGATKVEVFRVDPADYVDPEKTKEGQDKRFGGYAIMLKGEDQGEKLAQKAAALLLDRDNFLMNAAKGCKFSPGVGLRFWKGKEFAELLLCYKCSELKVIAPDTKAQGVTIPMADFEKGRAAFIKLAKELFPKDEVIQGLKDKTTDD